VSIASYARQAKKILYKTDGTPVYLIFFVTTKCGLRCDHCFYWHSTNVKKNELTVDEIEKISGSMGPFLQLTLTGGDSWLRDDLPEIAEIFYKNNKVKNITSCSNTTLTKKIDTIVIPMLEKCPDCDVTFDFSIDGIHEDHDRIRGVDGTFERVVETYRRLQALKKEYRNLNITGNITMQAANQDKLIPLYEWMRDELDPDHFNVLYIRGEPRNPATKNVEVEKYEEVTRLLEEDIRKGVYRGYKFMPDVLQAKDMILRRLIVKTVRENRYQLPCTAGALTGVIQTEGDVYPCELLDEKIGNLRESNYDFPSIWLSPRAREIRKQIRDTKCFCIHQCFLSNNILFNPRMIPKFAQTYLGIKWKKFITSLSPNGR
jgi:radical SAM protein with 4Fe4S-binding SPASM domain